MYVYQNGKLYVQDGDKLVGVEIHPNQVILIEGTETVLAEEFLLLTPAEVQLKFQIIEGKSYIFPKEEVPKEEVKKKRGGK